jgi:M6 family metalloprotease-like protein
MRYPQKKALWLGRVTGLICVLLVLPTAASAQPVSPESGGGLPAVALRVLQSDPTAFQFEYAWKQQLERARVNRRLLEQGALKGTPEQIAQMVAVSGVRKVPVFLCKYSDTGADPIARADLQQELFDGPWPDGTMTQYYDEISYGNIQLDGSVYNWVTLAHDDDYYAGGVYGLDPAFARVGELIHEILDAQDASVDFGDFDNDGPDGVPNSGDDDGYVDFIGIVHPETGGECFGGSTSNIWAHRWRLSGWDAGVYTTGDAAAGGGSIRIEDYTIMPALSCTGGMIEIGVFCHEFGHAFGLPDLYDTDTSDGNSEGIGWWGLMGAGNWNTPQHPAHMSAWSKAELGWLTPAVVAFDLYGFPVVSSSITPTAFKLWKNGTPGTEYFLVENRTQDGSDIDLLQPGLLVWHIDDALTTNANEAHKMIDLECADQTGSDHTANADGLDSMANRGDTGDPFCDGDIFSGATNPSSKAYNGTATSVVVSGIDGCGSRELVADLLVGQTEAGENLCMRDCGGDACAEPSPCDKFWASPEIYIDNNEDGIIDPPADGIDNKLFSRVRNVGSADASNVNVDFYYADPAMGLLYPSSATFIDADNIPIIGAGASEVAGILWTIPVPPATISHYCVGVIATNAHDGQSAESARDDNNVAQINIQELFAKAGTAVPPAPAETPGRLASDESGAWSRPAETGKAPEVFTTVREVNVCNTNPRTECVYQIVLGSPPNYDDVEIPADWEVELSFNQILLNPGQCEVLKVTVRDNNAVHGDRAVVPLTLLCNNEAVGGTVLTFNIDNVPPRRPCEFLVHRNTPPPTDNNPGDHIVEMSWDDSFFDAGGWPERVERWRLYNGAADGFPLSPANLIKETCIDEKPGTSRYEHFHDIIPGEANQWYALVAVDRAGNESDPCYAPSQVTVVGVEDLPGAGRQPMLAQNAPNPFNPITEIRYNLPGDGVVALVLYSQDGRFIRTLASGQQGAGGHRVIWDGRDESGRSVASGVYIYKLDFGGRQESRRLLLLR